jgi:hypothetical protein
MTRALVARAGARSSAHPARSSRRADSIGTVSLSVAVLALRAGMAMRGAAYRPRRISRSQAGGSAWNRPRAVRDVLP